jgi:hypothetical protein
VIMFDAAHAAARLKFSKLEALAARPGTPGEGEAAKAAIERLYQLFPDLRPDPLLGLFLQLDRTCDRNNGCCDRTGVVGPGTKTHAYSLRCACCGRHRGWLPKRATEILRVLHADGRLGTEPVLRDQSIVPGRKSP